jgi:hypothetical protein
MSSKKVKLPKVGSNAIVHGPTKKTKIQVLFIGDSRGQFMSRKCTSKE